jgi:rod shape-determining protein MreD
MNWVPTKLLLVLVTWLVVFAQCWFTGLRDLIHVQPDLVPSLVVYAAFHAGLPTTTLVALVGGFGADALSSGPFGLSVLPLVVLGAALHRRREVILQDSPWAQAALGLFGTLAVIVGTRVLLSMLWPFVSDRTGPGIFQPELRPALAALSGWRLGNAWQLFVQGLFGAAMTPPVFATFRWLESRLVYRRDNSPMWRRLQQERWKGRL